MEFKPATKFKLALLGGMFHQFVLGAVTISGAFGVYFVSYYKSVYAETSFYNSYLFNPLLTFFTTLVTPIGGIIDHFLGAKITILIGGLILYIGSLMLASSQQFSFAAFSVIILGLGFGISISVTIKNTCMFYPKKKGILFAILQSTMNLVSAGVNLIGEKLVNPSNRQKIDDIGCYPPEVASNCGAFVNILLILIPTGTALSMIILQEFDPTKDKQDNLLPTERAPVSEEDKKKAQEKYKNDIIKAATSRRLWIIFLISFFTSFQPFIVINTFKAIGVLLNVNQTLLKLTQSGMGIILCIMNPVWGILSDKYESKKLIIIMNVMGAFFAIILCFGLYYESLFSFGVCSNAILTAGITGVLTPYGMKVFSVKYTMEINGLVGFSLGFTNVFGAIFSLIVSEVLTDKGTLPYILCYMVGLTFNVFSILLVSRESDKPFDFDGTNTGFKQENLLTDKKSSEKTDTNTDNMVSLENK
jgi:MFS family permease